jgi:serine protein kinase
VAGSARSLKARARRRRRRAVAATPVVDVPHAEDQMAESQELLKLITQEIDTNKFEDEHWEGSFSQYLERIDENPFIVRTAHQRVYDMVLSYGTEEVERLKRKFVHYKFFDDPIDEGNDALFGLEDSLQRLMNVFKAAAHNFGPERRVLLLHGPVGSSKSTIVRLLKKGLEAYSRSAEGALYTFDWVIEGEKVRSMMNEEPLLLVPPGPRQRLLDHLNEKTRCSYKFKLDFDLRRTASASAPSSPRTRRTRTPPSSPATSTTARSPSTARTPTRARSTSTASSTSPTAASSSSSRSSSSTWPSSTTCSEREQEHKIKPKKFAQTDIDEVIIGHTNEPEYKKLQNNELMEAFRDRTIKIDIPYNTKPRRRDPHLQKDFNRRATSAASTSRRTRSRSRDVGRCSRASRSRRRHNLSLLQKMKLYDGKTLPGFTRTTSRSSARRPPREGMDGISPALHPGQDLQRPRPATARRASTRSWS